jgi:hypothetical protein
MRSALLVLCLVACGGATEPTNVQRNGGASNPAPVVPSAAPVGAEPGVATPTITFAKDSGFGCGDIYLQIADTTDTHFLTVHATRKGIGLSQPGDKATTTVGGNVSVGLDVYPRAGGEQRYCNDAIDNTVPTRSDQWPASSGSIVFELTDYVSDDDFVVVVSWSNVVIDTPTGPLRIGDGTSKKISVGWLAG